MISEPATLTADIEREIRSLWEQGKKIEAVKFYKDHSGSGLKDAKDAVEALQRRASLPGAAETESDLEAEVVRKLRQGGKIKAVKLYRIRTGATLLDSKQAVEVIAERHGITVEGGGALALWMAVLFAIAAVAVSMMLRQ